jgi:hypothetical protein
MAAEKPYDIVIVGAGITGFFTGLDLLRSKKGLRVAIADKYKFLGGRTFTFKADISGIPCQWEEGAARISENHRLTLALVKAFGLKTVPITGDLQFKAAGRQPEPDEFSRALPILLEPLRQISRATLGKTTLRKILEQIHGRLAADEFLIRYPYRAELEVMRADMALDLFMNEFRTFSGYVYLQEGFSELIARMEAEFKRLGGTVLAQHECVDVTAEKVVFLKGAPSAGPAREEVHIRCRTVVLAIPSAAAGRLPVARRLPWLSRLAMKPLVRVYTVFPPEADGKPWFAALPKMVTASVHRFIIPGGNALQISYTDSRDTEPILAVHKKGGEGAVGKWLTAELRELLGRKEIPEPVATKVHAWPEGVTYWLPGDYDPLATSRLACRPLPKEMPGLFMCGESYSTRQCWVEGALEHAAQTVDLIKKRVLG